MACVTICSGGISVSIAALRIFLPVSFETTIRIFPDFAFAFPFLSSGVFFEGLMIMFLVFIARHVNTIVWPKQSV